MLQALQSGKRSTLQDVSRASSVTRTPLMSQCDGARMPQCASLAGSPRNGWQQCWPAAPALAARRIHARTAPFLLSALTLKRLKIQPNNA